MSRNTNERVLTQIDEPQDVRAVLKAIEALSQDDLVEMGAWDVVDQLSSQAMFDAMEGTSEGVFRRPDGSFEAVATLYVTLQFGGSRDRTAMSDTYPAIVRGKLDGSGVKIQSVEIDNSSFYGEPEI